jgi:ribonuclease P protein component
VAWRIRDRATFEALRRSGARARRGPVTVTYAEIGSAPAPRVAYAVGRRAGSAVDRNRVRRRLRGAVAATEGLVPGAYLVAAGPEAARVEFEELTIQVARAMTSASARAGR